MICFIRIKNTFPFLLKFQDCLDKIKIKKSGKFLNRFCLTEKTQFFSLFWIRMYLTPYLNFVDLGLNTSFNMKPRM